MTLPPALRWLFWPASLIFGALVRLRARCYRHGLFAQRRLGGVVISVGNLTVGGTGKTPMVVWLAERLLAEGKRVGILIRGYRGSRATSDEVAMLLSRFGTQGQLLVGAGPDRYAQGRALQAQGVDWFVLDDGFQHLALARDVDILLIDATHPFGGGHLLPAGLLREPRAALARADIVVITRSDHAPAVEAVIRRHTEAPIFYAQTELREMRFLGGNGAQDEPAEWRERKLFAFCGIGNSAAFFDDLRRWGGSAVGQAAFPDHHHYSARDAQKIEQQARAFGAEALVCTEKDVYNLREVTFPKLPVYYCRMSLSLAHAEEFWDAMVATIQRKQRHIVR